MQKTGPENPRGGEQRPALRVVVPQPTEMSLSTDELARFGSLNWVRTTGPNRGEAFGVQQLKLRTDDGVIIMRKNEQGQLVKDVRVRDDIVATQIGGGPFAEHKAIWLNDDTVRAGSEELESQFVSIVFTRDVPLDAAHIQAAIDLALEFNQAVEQDRISRTIKRAERELLERLSVHGQQSFAERIQTKLHTVLQEAAIEEGILTEARETLPQRIRLLADKMEAMGIKAFANRLRSNSPIYHLPCFIREDWSPDTDDYDLAEWQNPELTKRRREAQRRWNRPTP